jgi:hypothetical protein
VSFEEGTEEDIAHNYNGASNGLVEGTASGRTACGNSNAASTGTGGNGLHTEDVQGSMPSIGTTLVALCRTTLGTSNRPPKHRGPTVQSSVLRTSGNRNSNDGP